MAGGEGRERLVEGKHLFLILTDRMGAFLRGTLIRGFTIRLDRKSYSKVR